ncbi:MAG: dockerin type I domain-containing protein [Candidatus Bathyarchaeota archaeon]|nr:dockerin type I domain-containing protein [Candidatus Bathyarchaeota archaeon]
MGKVFHRKSILSAILLSLLIFSTIASFAPMVQGDAGGIGKWVEITVEGGGGVVILTKLSSGETWSTSDYLIEKVGAGLVRLDAVEDSNFVFDHWLINGNEIDDGDRPWYEFRTEKGVTSITAVFKEVFTINAIVSVDAPNGTIALSSGGVGNSSWVIKVEKGGFQEFWFYADEGNHISAIAKNSEYLAPTSSISITNIQEDYTIVVFFSEDGYAWVPAGSNLEVYLTESASLSFTTVTTGFFAAGIELIRPEAWGAFTWDISMLGISYTDAKITLELDGYHSITRVITIVANDAFYCDVNGDLSVTAADLSLVANYNKATETHPNDFPYDPTYDTNRDGDITQDDVHLVNEYKGTEISWELMDPSKWTAEFDEENNITIVTIIPDHFSIFRGR